MSFLNNDSDCFQWFTKENIYSLQIPFDEIKERQIFNFWKILEKCLCSIDKNIPIDRARLTIKKTSIKYIKNLGDIDDINKHADEMIQKLEKENKNNGRRKINSRNIKSANYSSKDRRYYKFRNK